MSIQKPLTQIQLLQEKPFNPKRILLVDDNEKYRALMRQAALDAGHTVVFETNNVVDALDAVQTQEFDVALLDYHILDAPNSRYTAEDGGVKIAQAITQKDPYIGIFSISDQWGDTWPDPRFDADRPHQYDSHYDKNGWSDRRGPDLFAPWVHHNVNVIADLVGRFVPKEQNTYMLGMLEYAQRFNKERGR